MLDLHAQPRGRIIFLSRTGAQGIVELLGHRFEVDVSWPHRLVRAEVDLDAGRIRFFALRRREPNHQPLRREVAYTLPRRRYQQRQEKAVTSHRFSYLLTGNCCPLANKELPRKST